MKSGVEWDVEGVCSVKGGGEVGVEWDVVGGWRRGSVAVLGRQGQKEGVDRGRVGLEKGQGQQWREGRGIEWRVAGGQTTNLFELLLKLPQLQALLQLPLMVTPELTEVL